MAVDILKPKKVRPSFIKNAPHVSRGLIKAFGSNVFV